MEVKIGTEKFSINRGLQQGLASSPLLFNIYLEKILEEANITTNIAEIRCYADDMVCILNGDNGKQVMKKLEEVMAKYGLKINKSKTKVLWLNRVK